MGAMAADLVVLVFSLVCVGIIAGAAYKWRYHLKRWVKDEKYPYTWETDGVTRAKRGVIKAQWRLEDAEKYLEWKEKKEQSQENETEAG